jgi:hypothetical protein
MGTMGKIRVILQLSQGYDDLKYMDGKGCYLADALNKRLKSKFHAEVYGWGRFQIINKAGFVVFEGQCPDFAIEQCRNAGDKKRNMARFIEVPVALFKRTRCKELQTQA